MPSTTRETVRNLCKSILTKLENQKAIIFPARVRETVRDEVYGLIGGHILTDQDLKEQTLEKIGARADQIDDMELAESAPYRTARSIVRKSFGDDELNGLFFQRSLKDIAGSISSYMMSSANIEDVFESDEDLEKMIVDIIRRFNPGNLH